MWLAISRASATGSRSDAAQGLPERLAFEELHDDVRPALVLLDRHDAEDVGMLELLADRLFALKPRVESRDRSRTA